MKVRTENELYHSINRLIMDILKTDHRWSKKIQNMNLPTSTEYYLAVPTMLFGRHVVPYIVLIAFILLRFHCACYYGCSCMLTVIISEFLKNTIRRPRPPKSSISKRALPIRDDVCNPAFPSGDSGQAAVFSACLYLFFEKRILFLLLPLPTMFGRVYYGAHWIGYDWRCTDRICCYLLLITPAI